MPFAPNSPLLLSILVAELVSFKAKRLMQRVVIGMRVDKWWSDKIEVIIEQVKRVEDGREPNET